MQSLKEPELANSLWERFQLISALQRIPHALLLLGPQYAAIVDFAYKMSSAILCLQEQKPCGECKSCRLLSVKEHPDLCYLEPDKAGGIIKIDQIRELHDLVFTTAQLANGRVIIINPAEKMNTAAANALLKLLEEPPSKVIFILIAEHISTLPSTIISRCQQWRFPSAEHIKGDYLTIAQNYSPEAPRGILLSQLPLILEDLTKFMTSKLSVCAVADKWLSYDFTSLLWLIYLINAQLIDYKLNGCRYEKDWSEQINKLAGSLELIQLFKQLDQINEITKKLQRNISLNQSLVLENLLLGYKLIR